MWIKQNGTSEHLRPAAAAVDDGDDDDDAHNNAEGDLLSNGQHS